MKKDYIFTKEITDILDFPFVIREPTEQEFMFSINDKSILLNLILDDDVRIIFSKSQHLSFKLFDRIKDFLTLDKQRLEELARLWIQGFDIGFLKPSAEELAICHCFNACVEFRYATLYNFPFAGGYFDQPYLTMAYLSEMRSQLIKQLKVKK